MGKPLLDRRRQTTSDDTHTAWNFAVISGESASFQAGVAWADPFLVLPVFLGQLNTSTLLIGMVPILQRIGYILPQLPMASLLGHRPNRKPFLRWGVLLFRLPFLAFVIYLWLFGVTRAELIIGFMLFAYFSVAVGNGVVAVPWQDIIAKSIPAGIRGRFFGVMQFTTAALTFAIGFGVRAILNPHGLGFPKSYILLFTLTALFFTISTIGCWLMREPIRPVLEERETLGEVIAAIPRMLREQRSFRYLAVVSMTGAALILTTSFYTAYITRVLHVPSPMVGVYIVATTIGGMASSLVWAHLNDRYGPRLPIRGGTGALLLTPLLALLLPPLGRWIETFFGGPGTVLPYLFGALFFVAGSSNNGLWIGMNNYLYDMASHEERHRYIAIMSTLALPAALLPWLVGELLEIISYPTVFAGLAVIAAGLFIVACRLPEPGGVTR